MRWVTNIQHKLQNKVDSICIKNPLDFINVDDLIYNVADQLIDKIDAIEQVVTGVSVKVKLTDYFNIQPQSEQLYITMLNTHHNIPQMIHKIMLNEGYGVVDVVERTFTFNTHKRKITNFDLQFTVRAIKQNDTKQTT